MAQTFKQRVTALSGLPADDNELGVWLTSGVQDIIRRIKLVDPAMLYRFSQNVVLTGSGGSLMGSLCLILDIHRNGYECKQIDTSLRHRAARSSSMYRATSSYPAFYTLNNRLYILPVPTDTEPAGISVVKPTAVAATDESINYFPAELYYLIDTYASLQNIISKISNVSFPSDVSLPVLPVLGTFVTVSESLPTYSVIALLTLPSVPSDADIDFSGIPSTPTFLAPSPPALPTLSLGSDLSITALTLSSTPPVMEAISISDGAITSFGDAPQYVPPVVELASVPTFNAIALPSVPAVDFDVTKIGASAFVPPDIPSVDMTISKTLTDAIEVAGVALPTMSFPSAPTITEADLESIGAPVPPPDPSFTTPTITLGDPPVYVGPTNALNVQTALGTITTQIESDEDIELAAQKISQVQVVVADFASKVENSLNQFNEDNEIYQATLKKEIEEARLLNTMESNEYAAKLERYKAEVQAYAAAISAEIARFTNNEVQYTINVWTVQTQSTIAEYQAKAGAIVQEYAQRIASKSNLTEAEVSIYGSELKRVSTLNQLNISKYQMELVHAVSSYQAQSSTRLGEYDRDTANKAAKNSAYIANYSAQVTSAVQRYSQEEIQGKLAKWIAQRNTELAEYQANMENAVRQFNEEVEEYRAIIQKNIEEARNQIQSDTEEYRAKLQKYSGELDEYKTAVNAEVQEYVQLVQSEVVNWTTKRSNLVDEFRIKSSNELQRYATELNDETQQFTASFQTWSKLIEKAIVQFREETGYDMSKYAQEATAIVTKQRADIENSNSEFQSGIAKYTADLKYVDDYNNRLIASYVQGIGAYQAEAGMVIQNFTAKIQERSQELTRLFNLYKELADRYEKGFTLIRSNA